MRRTIIILTVLLMASTASAQLPYFFHCQHNEKEPLEVQLCASLAAAMDRNADMIDADDPDKPFFHLIILPRARGGYISVTIASNLIYPPLNGLALSAYLGNFIVIPDGLEDSLADEVMRHVAIGTSKWMIQAEKSILAIPRDPTVTGLMADWFTTPATEVQTNE